ncbi:hypothetical protein ACHAWC_000158, partial [Mediolabrus comicus]
VGGGAWCHGRCQNSEEVLWKKRRGRSCCWLCIRIKLMEKEFGRVWNSPVLKKDPAAGGISSHYNYNIDAILLLFLPSITLVPIMSSS